MDFGELIEVDNIFFKMLYLEKSINWGSIYIIFMIYDLSEVKIDLCPDKRAFSKKINNT